MIMNDITNLDLTKLEKQLADMEKANQERYLEAQTKSTGVSYAQGVSGQVIASKQAPATPNAALFKGSLPELKRLQALIKAAVKNQKGREKIVLPVAALVLLTLPFLITHIIPAILIWCWFFVPLLVFNNTVVLHLVRFCKLKVETASDCFLVLLTLCVCSQFFVGRLPSHSIKDNLAASDGRLFSFRLWVLLDSCFCFKLPPITPSCSTAAIRLTLASLMTSSIRAQRTVIFAWQEKPGKTRSRLSVGFRLAVPL